MMRLAAVAVLAGVVALGPVDALAQKKGAAQGQVFVQAVDKDFDSMREALELAITNRGLVIDHVSNIGDMLARTGKDIGATKQIYGKGQSLQFCSANLSRATMEADPNNIAFCPYMVFLYTLPDNPKKVYVGYRRLAMIGSPASKKSLKEVETLLDEIVQEAVSW